MSLASEASPASLVGRGRPTHSGEIRRRDTARAAALPASRTGARSTSTVSTLLDRALEPKAERRGNGLAA